MRAAARIKVGAIVFSDRSFPHWGEHIGVGEEYRLFQYSPLDTRHNRYDLSAHGYGLAGAYGNGSLFVSKKDVILVDVSEDDYDSIFMPAIPVKEEKRLEPGYYLVVEDDYSEIVKVQRHEEVSRFGVFKAQSKHDFPGNPQWYGPINLFALMSQPSNLSQ